MKKKITLFCVVLALAVTFAAAMSPDAAKVADFHANRAKDFEAQKLQGSTEDVMPLEGSSTGEFLNVTIPVLGTATGHFLTTVFGKKFAAFHALPYANKMQIPDERFKYATQWDANVAWPVQPYDATRLRDRCPQGSYLSDSSSGSEDCLHLSVYTSLTSLENLAQDSWKGRPVIVFIHGGSYTSGEATLYMPTKLLSQDVVVAVVQYRLSTLGFLYSGTEDAPGNQGLHDQLLAIRWVHKYAQYFGGDASLLTVMGQSAGSASTSLLMTSPLLTPKYNDGEELVQRFIAMSGSALEYWTIGHDPAKDFQTQLEAADCYEKRGKVMTVPEQMECMRDDRNLDELVAASYSVYANDRAEGGLGFIGVVPVVQTDVIAVVPEENLVLPQHPSDALDDGAFWQRPVLMGSTRDEGSMVVGLVYQQFLVPKNYFNDTNYLEFHFLPKIASSFGFEDVTNSVSNAFELGFYPSGANFGNWDEVVGGHVDLCGMLMLKTGQWTQAHMIKAANATNPVYFYSFEYESDDSMFPYIVPGGNNIPVPAGITHTDDLLYFFNLPGYFNETEKAMIKKMTTLYYNFAKYGNPTPPETKQDWSDWTTEWPQFFPESKMIQVLAANMRADQDFISRWNYNMNGYPDGEGEGEEDLEAEEGELEMSWHEEVSGSCGGVGG